MKKFNYKQVGETLFKSSKRIDIQVSGVDNRMIRPDEIRYLIQKFEKQYPDSQFLVTGLGVSGLHELGDTTKHHTSTLKKFSTSFKLLDEEEYLNGRVKEETKFKEYFQFNISIVIPHNKVKIKFKT